MSTRTKLILLLVAVALLFILLVVFDTFFKSQRDSQDLDAFRAFTDSALLKVTEALADKVDLDGLQCAQQPVARPFSLNKSRKACEIRIPPDRDTEVRTAKLQVSNGNPSAGTPDVYVFAEFDESDFPERERDPAKCFTADSPPGAFRLEVVYDSGESVDNSWSCWLRQDRGEPVSIVALEDGGRLNLECVGCDSGSRSLSLRLR